LVSAIEAKLCGVACSFLDKQLTNLKSGPFAFTVHLDFATQDAQLQRTLIAKPLS
jgi:hypothetical protein